MSFTQSFVLRARYVDIFRFLDLNLVESIFENSSSNFRGSQHIRWFSSHINQFYSFHRYD